MRKRIVLLAVLAALSGAAAILTRVGPAQGQAYPQPQALMAFAFESVTVDNTSGGVALTSDTYAPATYGGAYRALMTNETAQIRFTYDGTAPTATAGHVAEAGDVIVLTGRTNITAFRAIRTGGTSATLRVTYERYRLGQ